MIDYSCDVVHNKLQYVLTISCPRSTAVLTVEIDWHCYNATLHVTFAVSCSILPLIMYIWLLYNTADKLLQQVVENLVVTHVMSLAAEVFSTLWVVINCTPSFSITLSLSTDETLLMGEWRAKCIAEGEGYICWVTLHPQQSIWKWKEQQKTEGDGGLWIQEECHKLAIKSRKLNEWMKETTFCFYRAACNADAVLWWEFCLSVRPSVRHTRELWQNGRKICPDLYTIWQII